MSNTPSALRITVPSAALPLSTMTTLASFRDYRSAEALVDRMSDGGFPVEHTRIVGTGISTVEQITGRLTNGKAAAYGLGGGAWFGLFIGLLFSLFTPLVYWWVAVLGSVAFGALFGAGFGLLAHVMTAGRRDFSSTAGFAVDSYDVQVDESHAASAQQYVIAA